MKRRSLKVFALEMTHFALEGVRWNAEMCSQKAEEQMIATMSELTTACGETFDYKYFLCYVYHMISLMIQNVGINRNNRLFQSWFMFSTMTAPVIWCATVLISKILLAGLPWRCIRFRRCARIIRPLVEMSLDVFKTMIIIAPILAIGLGFLFSSASSSEQFTFSSYIPFSSELNKYQAIYQANSAVYDAWYAHSVFAIFWGSLLLAVCGVFVHLHETCFEGHVHRETRIFNKHIEKQGSIVTFWGYLFQGFGCFSSEQQRTLKKWEDEEVPVGWRDNHMCSGLFMLIPFVCLVATACLNIPVLAGYVTWTMDYESQEIAQGRIKYCESWSAFFDLPEPFGGLVPVPTHHRPRANPSSPKYMYSFSLQEYCRDDKDMNFFAKFSNGTSCTVASISHNITHQLPEFYSQDNNYSRYSFWVFVGLLCVIIYSPCQEIIMLLHHEEQENSKLKEK